MNLKMEVSVCETKKKYQKSLEIVDFTPLLFWLTPSKRSHCKVTFRHFRLMFRLEVLRVVSDVGSLPCENRGALRCFHLDGLRVCS